MKQNRKFGLESKFTRIISLVLILAMVLQLIPISAIASSPKEVGSFISNSTYDD